MCILLTSDRPMLPVRQILAVQRIKGVHLQYVYCICCKEFLVSRYEKLSSFLVRGDNLVVGIIANVQPPSTLYGCLKLLFY